jgi:hypothetical protein
MSGSVMAAAQVVENLKSGAIAPVLPANESQARVLIDLTPDVQREVWQQVVSTAPNGKITAKHIKGIVEQHTDKLSSPKPTRSRSLADSASETPTVAACQQCEVYRQEIAGLHACINELEAQLASSRPPIASDDDIRNLLEEGKTTRQIIEVLRVNDRRITRLRRQVKLNVSGTA